MPDQVLGLVFCSLMLATAFSVSNGHDGWQLRLQAEKHANRISSKVMPRATAHGRALCARARMRESLSCMETAPGFYVLSELPSVWWRRTPTGAVWKDVQEPSSRAPSGLERRCGPGLELRRPPPPAGSLIIQGCATGRVGTLQQLLRSVCIWVSSVIRPGGSENQGCGSSHRQGATRCDRWCRLQGHSSSSGET